MNFVVRSFLFFLLSCVSVFSEEVPNAVLFRMGSERLVLHEVLESMNAGEFAILNFTSVNCIPCKKEIPELLRIAEKNPNIKLFIIFAESNPKDFASSLGVKSYYTDGLGVVQNKFGVKEYPVTILISRDKNLMSRIEGYKEKKLQETIQKALERR
jgi:thiol-disulfide isomerase/thioredoxin